MPNSRVLLGARSCKSATTKAHLEEARTDSKKISKYLPLSPQALFIAPLPYLTAASYLSSTSLSSHRSRYSPTPYPKVPSLFSFNTIRTTTMSAFVSPFTVSFRSSLRGTALSSPCASGRPAISMVASKAVPFLEAPPKLDGSMVGDVGFDPLYFSDYINLEYAAAAELKNGRVAMLACVGMLVQEFVHLPNPMFAEPNPIKAIYSVPVEGWIQILAFISVVELATFKTTYETMGDYGFDPLGMGKEDKLADLKLKELKNARLAMIASIGFIMQILVTDKPIFAQLASLGQ